LVAKTANLGRDAALAVLAAMNAKYANLVDPLLSQERVDAMLRWLAKDILASEGLESFPDGDNAGRRNADGHYHFEIVPIPQRNGTDIPFDGNVYGFLREVEEGQMPPLMKLPDNLSMRQALAVREVVAGAEEELDV
jgi:hypothetical protein